MIEDTVESVSMLPLSQETLVNNFVVEHEKSNNLCYIPCDKPVVMDPPIVIFEPCIITLETGEVIDVQGNNCYDNSKLVCVSPLTYFSKKKKNKTTKEFKLPDPKTREYLNTEKIEHTNESMKTRNAGKQLYRTKAIERDRLEKLRDRRAEYQLMSNARVKYVKSIWKKRRLREEGTDFWPKNRFFFIVIDYFLALSLPKNLLPMSKFSYNYLM